MNKLGQKYIFFSIIQIFVRLFWIKMQKIYFYRLKISQSGSDPREGRFGFFVFGLNG